MLLLIAAITAFMGWKASHVEMAYNFAKVVPQDNPKYLDYLSFKEKFGEDGNVMVIGVRVQNLFDLRFFNSWHTLGEQIQKVHGVEDILSIDRCFNLIKDTSNGKVKVDTLFKGAVATQSVLDSLQKIFTSLPFYRYRLYNPDSNSTIMAVRIKQSVLDSKERIAVVDSIRHLGDAFSKLVGTEIHYSGLPLIRTILATQVADELKLFLLLAMLVTAIVLFLLLRSLLAVLFSMIVVGIAVTWSVGTIVLFGFKITLLNGLIPPLVVVIAITNCVYLLNKYHIEFVKHGNKIMALARVVEKLGVATLFTNLTAAIGFGVFYFTKSAVLKEFGLVAGLNIAGIFLISIIVIPCVFSFLPSPRPRHIGYLNFRMLKWVLNVLDSWTKNHRKIIYAVTGSLVIAGLAGMMQLKATGFIVDDIPHKHRVYVDLKFFENNFRGVMPFEITVDAKTKYGLRKNNTLQKISDLQDTLAACKELSPSLSVDDGIKFVNQAQNGGESSAFMMPGGQKDNIVFAYLTKQKNKRLLTTFIDTAQQVARISANMADIGSHEMPLLLARLQPKIDKIFSDTSKWKVSFTGTSIIFLEGNHFIINGLIESLLLALVLIALCMAYLFRSFRMIFFSVLPNLVPLIITAGMMGYFGIPLKPSTVLIFSIAFGIAIDNAIRFLAKYQQELHRHNWAIGQTVSVALREAGISIIYTSIILFFGFIIFTASSFGGTVYLGLLTSITLVVAMFNNLLLLPSLLLSLEQWVDRRALKKGTLAESLGDDDNLSSEIISQPKKSDDEKIQGA